MHLRDALNEFCTAKATNLSPKTIDWYRIQIGAFCTWLDTELAAGQLGNWFAPTTFERYYAYLARPADVSPAGRGLKPASVRGAHRALSAFFGWLAKRKHADGRPYIPNNPLVGVEAPHVPKRQPRRTTPDQYEDLLRSISLANNWIDARDYLLVSTLFLCGLRVAELCRLRIEDFDVRNRLLIVREKKGGDDHLVPLLEPVTRAFVAYLYIRPVWPSSEIFLASDGAGGVDGVLSTNGVRHRLTQLCKRAGIPRLTPHRFRHGLARYMLDKGADMALIQRILGHQRMSTTSEIYALWDNLEGVAAQYKAVMADIGVRKRPDEKP